MEIRIKKLIQSYETLVDIKQSIVNGLYEEYPDLTYDLLDCYERDSEKRQNDLENYQDQQYWRGFIDSRKQVIGELKKLYMEVQ